MILLICANLLIIMCFAHENSEESKKSTYIQQQKQENIQDIDEMSPGFWYGTRYFLENDRSRLANFAKKNIEQIKQIRLKNSKQEPIANVTYLDGEEINERTL